MNKLPSYTAIANEGVMYSTPSPSQSISHESILSSGFKPGEFINFKGEVCGSNSSAGLQEYFYLDSEFNPRWRTE